jgi:predicted MPP superfamily phosphohydrolase
MSTKYIRVASDLHLEGFMGRNIETLQIDMLPKHENDAESILVLAGDISSSPTQLCQFLKVIENRFRRVVYVPGNHEYYNNDFSTWTPAVRDALEQNCPNTSAALSEVKIEIIDGIRFIFGTLWADGGDSLHSQAKVGAGLWDFSIIRDKGMRFTVQDMQQVHKAQKSQIKQALAMPFEGKTIVVSHHMPSYRLCHPRFGTEINGGFASNCDAILAGDDHPDIWIHGHTHDTIDTELFETRIVCNPRGYQREANKSEFNTFAPKFIDV